MWILSDVNELRNFVNFNTSSFLQKNFSNTYWNFVINAKALILMDT